MWRLFDEHPEACDNTLLIAERANVEIEFGKPQLPSFPLPGGLRLRQPRTFDHLTFEGRAAAMG